MSQENLELLRRMAAAINADDLPDGFVTEDFELSNATTAVTDATYHGYEGALQWRRDMFDVVDDARYEIDEILAAHDDYVVAANHLVGRGSSSGAPVDLRWVTAFWFRDGKLARVAGYNTRRAALEAVGLSG
jgi:ketosteroid isomerase-like protein